ncbi:MAG: EF-hand domain-containing protein [Sulfuricurvum sp.]|nr:EF-hand domain-containing protein [Sulfuricurvum sp.]
MTINGGSVWATSTQSYSGGNVQSQSSASAMAPTNYSSMMQEAGNALIASLDTNNNGTIDKTEFSQAAEALAQKTGNTYNTDTAFSAIDKNSDGSISADELMNALKQSQAQRENKKHTASSTQQSSQTLQTTTASATDTSGAAKLQSILMDRILSAYASTATTPSSTTLAKA